MSPEQIDAATNAWIWAEDQAAIYGPGLALFAAGIAVSWACARAGRWRTRRRDIQRLEAFANHPAHRARKEDR
ncbi:hypothetical protein CLM62_12540 [Streptomyces sp. SA15]|uniref:hypothetical protein n=1 Tax=Streptomyces sp. SA15 TaxID=934019 RepID=UPI000BB014D2|nr:hypothetical protein [Streptomyces sp. SA15]PAZ15619.1 hypothetical protein CLM62_12540 [Streptomyces sp. SA15]